MNGLCVAGCSTGNNRSCDSGSTTSSPGVATTKHRHLAASTGSAAWRILSVQVTRSYPTCSISPTILSRFYDLRATSKPGMPVMWKFRMFLTPKRRPVTCIGHIAFSTIYEGEDVGLLRRAKNWRFHTAKVYTVVSSYLNIFITSRSMWQFCGWPAVCKIWCTYLICLSSK
jgi:hypothetical protein